MHNIKKLSDRDLELVSAGFDVVEGYSYSASKNVRYILVGSLSKEERKVLNESGYSLEGKFLDDHEKNIEVFLNSKGFQMHHYTFLELRGYNLYVNFDNDFLK